MPQRTRESDHNLHTCNRAIRPEMDRMETNKGGKRQLMRAGVSRERLEQKERISVFYLKIIFGLLFINSFHDYFN